MKLYIHINKKKRAIALFLLRVSYFPDTNIDTSALPQIIFSSFFSNDNGQFIYDPSEAKHQKQNSMIRKSVIEQFSGPT